MLLGLNAPIDELARGFADAAASRTCRGFAVGRTIFDEPARAWLADAIDDDGLVAGVRKSFEALIDAWRGARGGENKMSMVQLTMAQALIRYLAAQRTVQRRARSAALRRRVGDLRPRQRRRRRRGALSASRRAADVSRAQRAGDGARGDRVREGALPPADDGVHDVDRAGRDQPRHRGGDGARQPPAGAASCPATSSSRARPTRCCSRSRISTTAASRPTTASGRSRATSTGSSHPAQLLTALPRAIAVLTDPALCGPVTLALPQDVQAKAYDYPDRILRARARVDIRAPAARGSRARRGGRSCCARRSGPSDRRGRRRALQRARRAGARALRRSARRAGRRNAGGQGRAALGPSAAGGPDRRHRRHGGQRARARGGSRDRGRHAAAGLHDRLAFAVPAGAARRDQRQRVRRAQVARASPCIGDASSDARRARRRVLRGWTAERRVARARDARGARVARRPCRRSSACATSRRRRCRTTAR